MYNIFMYICIYICMYIYVYLCVYIHICMYLYKHRFEGFKSYKKLSKTIQTYIKLITTYIKRITIYIKHVNKLHCCYILLCFAVLLLYFACGFMPAAPRDSLESEGVVGNREKSPGAGCLGPVLEGSWGHLEFFCNIFIVLYSFFIAFE